MRCLSPRASEEAWQTDVAWSIASRRHRTSCRSCFRGAFVARLATKESMGMAAGLVVQRQLLSES